MENSYFQRALQILLAPSPNVAGLKTLTSDQVGVLLKSLYTVKDNRQRVVEEGRRLVSALERIRDDFPRGHKKREEIDSVIKSLSLFFYSLYDEGV